MFFECLGYIPLLGIAMVLNIIIGTFNNVSLKKETFKIRILFRGIVKALIVCLASLGLAYIMDNIHVDVSIMTPSSLLEAAVIYYSGKVALGMKTMLFPDKENISLTEILQNSKNVLGGSKVRNTTGTIINDSSPRKSVVTEIEDTESLSQ